MNRSVHDTRTVPPLLYMYIYKQESCCSSETVKKCLLPCDKLTATYYLSEFSSPGSLSFRRGEPLHPHYDYGSCMLNWWRDERFPSFVLLPECSVLMSAADVHPGASSERAEEAISLASGNMDIESTASECSSRDDKSFGELLEVVTYTVARLKLNWPQEQENPRHSKLVDRFLSGGQGEGPQCQSLPFFTNLHEEFSRSWSRLYSSHI